VTTDYRGISTVNDGCGQSCENEFITCLSIWLMKPEDNTQLELTTIYPPHFPLFLCLFYISHFPSLPFKPSLCLFSLSFWSLCFYKAALCSLGRLIVFGSLCLSFRLLCWIFKLARANNFAIREAACNSP